MTGDVQVPDGDRDVDLATQIATEHWITTFQGIRCVGCGWWEPRHMEDNSHAMRRHVAEMTIAALASQSAPTASMVERMEAVYDTFGEDVSADFCAGYLRAVDEVDMNGKYHQTGAPAPTVTEEVFMRERIATAIEGDDWFDPTNIVHHVPDFREGIEYATTRHARIARAGIGEVDRG